MTLLRKYEKYRENYPRVKGLDSIFAKFPPSENNHVKSILVVLRCLGKDMAQKGAG